MSNMAEKIVEAQYKNAFLHSAKTEALSVPNVRKILSDVVSLPLRDTRDQSKVG